MEKFGGNWTEQKLNAFIKYVKAYLMIMNKMKVKYNWQTIYFDGFAGYGKRTDPLEKEGDSLYFDFIENDVEELALYEGSVSRILNLTSPFIFDWYYFVDTKKKYVENLKKIRADINHIDKERIRIREDNCNSQLKKLAEGLKSNRNLVSLIFLDPFGMQIDWGAIKDLEGTHSDVWILIPSGVGINRLLDRKGELNHIGKLEDFFGLPRDEIENIFYESENEDTLFGVNEKTNKINHPITKIVEIYVRQLKTVWKFVTVNPLVLTNTRNTPIFHLLFASNNAAGLNIAKDIIERG
jgi:three-Cys-motif partner protein